MESDLVLGLRFLDGRRQLHTCRAGSAVRMLRHPRFRQPVIVGPFVLVHPPSRRLVVTPESPEQVVRVESVPALDHHELDGVSKTHDESIEGQLALNVVA